MSNAVFPDMAGLMPTRSRTPIWKTVTRESASGKELRAALMTSPRYRYSLSFEFLREGNGRTELQQIIGLFNACYGSFDTFLYLDPEDSTATAQQFGVGNGSSTQFQLVRTYGSFVEPIPAVSGTPSIYKAGVLQSTPGNYSVSSSGMVSFVTPPGAGQVLTWTGAFYWRCRFVRDETEFARFLHQLWESKRVEFITVKGES